MTLILAIFLYLLGFFIPYSHPIIYGIVAELVVVILFFSSFSKTPYSKSIEKSGWFCMLFWSLSNTVCFTWFGEPVLIHYIIGIIELFLFVSFFLYSQIRSYEIKSDQYNTEDSFIVFKRPKNLLGFIFSCILTPVSSVCVVSQGLKYGYKMSFPFDQREYKQKENHILIKIDMSPDEVKKIMEPWLKARWTFKTNCCHIIQQLFPDIKFHDIRDRLPCYFINTIIKNKVIK